MLSGIFSRVFDQPGNEALFPIFFFDKEARDGPYVFVFQTVVAAEAEVAGAGHQRGAPLDSKNASKSVQVFLSTGFTFIFGAFVAAMGRGFYPRGAIFIPGRVKK